MKDLARFFMLETDMILCIRELKPEVDLFEFPMAKYLVLFGSLLTNLNAI